MIDIYALAHRRVVFFFLNVSLKESDGYCNLCTSLEYHYLYYEMHTLARNLDYNTNRDLINPIRFRCVVNYSNHKYSSQKGKFLLHTILSQYIRVILTLRSLYLFILSFVLVYTANIFYILSSFLRLYCLNTVAENTLIWDIERV